MWEVKGYALKMCEDDFGLALPITIGGASMTANDEIRIAIKTEENGETIIEKTFDNIEDNTISLELTETDTEKLPVGHYVYSLDWYQDGAFMCNIIPVGSFKVVDKA